MTKELKKELNLILKFIQRYDNNFAKSLFLSNLGGIINENIYDIFKK
jgi:hypothetical protein